MKYNVSVKKGNFDGDIFFEATVNELPDVAEYADTFEEAYGLAIDAIGTTREAFVEQGRVMPAPISNKRMNAMHTDLRINMIEVVGMDCRTITFTIPPSVSIEQFMVTYTQKVAEIDDYWVAYDKAEILAELEDFEWMGWDEQYTVTHPKPPKALVPEHCIEQAGGTVLVLDGIKVTQFGHIIE